MEKIIENTDKMFKTHIIRLLRNNKNHVQDGMIMAAYTGFNVGFGTGTIKYVKVDNDKGF